MTDQIPNQSLGEFLDGIADSEAPILHEGRRIAVAELAADSRRVAAGLVALGIEPGDRVGVWLPNIPQWLVMYFACGRAGAIAVTVNTRFRSTEVADIVGRSGCKVLVFWPGFKNIDFAGILREVDPAALSGLETVIVYREDPEEVINPPLLGRRTLGFEELLQEAPLAVDRGGPDSPCMIFTTSGTTSVPKFVLHRQAAVSVHAHEVARAHGYCAADACLLQLLPFCGAFGHAQVMANLAARRPMILQTVFDAAGALSLARQHCVTHFNGSDEMIARMLAASDEAQPIPTLRFCGFARFTGIAGLVEDAARRGIRMRGLYGMSEVQALFALQPDDDPERIALGGGIPVSPQAVVRFRDPDSGQLLVAGESGEIEICAPSMLVRYFENPEATAAAFTTDGFVRTGDIGYSTGNGGFVFVTRAGDVLRLGGYLVAPAEIEAHLQRHEAVDGAAVVAGANDHAAKAIAFVTLKPGATAEESELIAFCRCGLARFKNPARIFIIDTIPTVPGPNGAKVRRNLLRDWAREKMAPT